MTSFGKSMKKYAEVGLSRLAVALPSKLSLEELQDYTALVCKMAKKLQIFLKWIQFIDSLKADITNLNLTPQTCTNNSKYSQITLIKVEVS
jgi:hypothetical protein